VRARAALPDQGQDDVGPRFERLPPAPDGPPDMAAMAAAAEAAGFEILGPPIEASPGRPR
jgi:hypothetical protein